MFILKQFPVTLLLIVVMWVLHFVDNDWVEATGLTTVTIGGSVVVTFFAILFLSLIHISEPTRPY